MQCFSRLSVLVSMLLEAMLRMESVCKGRSVVPFAAAFLGAWILPYWNFRLSPLINIINLIDNVLSVLVTPLHMIRESDTAKINKERLIYASLPLGFRAKLQSTKDITISTPEGHSLPARVYTPLTVKPNSPIIVFFHGGGYVIGDVPMYEFVTTNLASKTSYIVISIEYRRAPEHKFPAAHLDAIAATEWVHYHAHEFGGDASKIAVAGDSAGGNLAAIVAAELPHVVKFQSLIYPGITFAVFSDSAASNAYAPVLPLARVSWFSRRYFRGVEDLLHPLACPRARYNS